MNDKEKLSIELRSALEQLVEDNLQGIGIFKDKIIDYDKWKEKAINQIRSVYSDKAIELFLMPKDNRKIDSPDGFARVTGPDGHIMEIYFKINNGIITDSSFQTDGCKGFIASGSMVAQIIKHKSINIIERITSQDIKDALGGLPNENDHCALLAVNTLKEALKNYIERQKAK